MEEVVKQQIISDLPASTVRIWLHPYRCAAILLLTWAFAFAFLLAINLTGDRTYLWGATAFASLAVVGHLVVVKALRRVQRKIGAMINACENMGSKAAPCADERKPCC